MISKDDIEAFKEEQPAMNAGHVFRYEQDGPDGDPGMSFTVKQLDGYPAELAFTVSDDWFNSDKMSIFLPKHVVREMIKAMEKVL